MSPKLSRRSVLRHAAAGGFGFLGLRSALEQRAFGQQPAGFGPLVTDPAGMLDLPAGFKYRAFSVTGEMMSDGYRVPGVHDGMAAYPGPNGTTILVRNHEMQTAAPGAGGSPYPNSASYAATNPAKVYDAGTAAPASGGTTNLVYNTRLKRLESHFLSLTGTIRNCAGGLTPWNSWMTCEETGLKTGYTQGGSVMAKDHGWVFDVAATATPGLQTPVPLKALGRFSHEALAIDPNTGIVYETEDQGDSVFYRFIPNTPGNMQAGQLQALRFKNAAIQDTRNFTGMAITTGVQYDVEWVNLTDVESPGDNLRHQAAGLGAAIFAREEGCWWGNSAIYFACTSGGLARLGQIFKYTPSPTEGTAAESTSPAKLELFIEPTSDAQFAAPDNICVAPFGDIIVCEDGSGTEYVHGVTQTGAVYKLAANTLNSSEFAGACFSPDGTTLFVNIQSPGITYAITGPWQRRVA